MGEGNDAKFPCASCGREFKWKPELAGKKAKCKCGAVVAVPHARPGAEPAAAEDDPFEFADTPEPITPRRGGTVAPAPPMPAPQQIACPVCNNPAPPTAVLCTNCGFNFRTGVRMPGSGRVVARPAATGGIAADTYEQAAKFSWMAPLVAILLGCCTVGARNSGPGVGFAIAGLQLLLIVGGLAAGIFGIVGSKKFGPERLLMPSITGIVLNGLIIGLNIYLFTMLLSGRAPFGRTARAGSGGAGGPGSTAVAPRTPQQMQQDGEDAFLKEDGWMAIHPHRGAVITLVTIPDHTPAASQILSNLGTRVSVLILAVDNSRGGDSFDIDPTGATLQLTDGTSQAMPDVTQVLQSAKSERDQAVRAFGPPFTVMPGRQLVGKFLFLPPNIDPATIAGVSLKVGGRPTRVSGKFMTAAQKQAATNGGGR